jgi:hypothetical protein
MLGLDGHDRETVGCARTIATSLAYSRIDERPPRRIRQLPALATPALFGRAGLIVDQRSDAPDLAQLALDLIEAFPAGNRGTRREVHTVAILPRLFSHDPDLLNPFRTQLLG